MNIIYNVLHQLQFDKFYGISKEIEMCKGKNKLSFNIEHIKRNFFMLFKKSK